MSKIKNINFMWTPIGFVILIAILTNSKTDSALLLLVAIGLYNIFDRKGMV